jgi:hypothetical protein
MIVSISSTSLEQKESKPRPPPPLSLSLICILNLFRSNRTGTSGAQLKEAAEINKSLSLLWRCLNGVKRKGNASNDPVPFRESKLTHLLMPVLMRTGTSGTSMITCINPKAEDYDETLSILANSSMAHEIREIPKIGRTLATSGNPSAPYPFLHQNSSRGSVLTGEKNKLRSSNLVEKAPNSSKKRDASCLSRKFSQESIETLLSSTVAATGSVSGDGSVDYKIQIALLNEKIAELENENSIIQMEQLEKERLIREDVCQEMAERSGTLLEQIRNLQDELYSLKNHHADAHKSVKKAKRLHDIISRDLVTNDLRETEEEMEVVKLNYEKEIKSLKTEVRNLKAELSDWRKKAESAMKIIKERGTGAVDVTQSTASIPSLSSITTTTAAAVNNENDDSNYHYLASPAVIAAETFDERMQRDQRFNKHKKLAELSPKMNQNKSSSLEKPREPLGNVSPNNSPLEAENASQDQLAINKFSQKVLLSNLGRSPPPSPHRSSDALPIAPPQSDFKLNSAPFVPNRVLRSQLRA